MNLLEAIKAQYDAALTQGIILLRLAISDAAFKELHDAKLIAQDARLKYRGATIALVPMSAAFLTSKPEGV